MCGCGCGYWQLDWEMCGCGCGWQKWKVNNTGVLCEAVVVDGDTKLTDN